MSKKCCIFATENKKDFEILIHKHTRDDHRDVDW